MDEMQQENCISALEACRLCPRNCGVNRLAGQRGYCGQGAELRAARAALHYWEEPVLSGVAQSDVVQPDVTQSVVMQSGVVQPGVTQSVVMQPGVVQSKERGSGAVFFSGCNLRCVFCQNHDIALGQVGKEITSERLCEIFFELKEKGAYNINLVTATPFIPQVCEAIRNAKEKGFDLPIVFNCGGYESVEALKMLDGLVDIYLPDMKYYSQENGKKYANAADYFEKAKLAIEEMYRQVGDPIFGEDGIMKRGVIVRHLVLPGEVAESKRILRYLHETYADHIYISIMNQYTPMEDALNRCNAKENLPELYRKVTADEYERVVDFAIKIGIENAFIQEGETAEESFIPKFNCEGI